MNGIVIDTNVFVAAGFNSRSAAARIVAAVREGHFQLVWNKPTRRETETILRRIPGLGWARVADLFRPEGEFTGPVDPDAFVMIADRDDRKFVALSAATPLPAAVKILRCFFAANRCSSMTSTPAGSGMPGHFGIRITDANKDKLVGELDVDDRHLNNSGHVHGGALAAFADDLGGNCRIYASRP